jgi:hypothetical protein
MSKSADDLFREELEEALADKQWRLDNIYSIVDKQGRKVKFVRNNIQRLLSKVQASRKMILKSRQVGISTNELIDCLDDTIYQDNVTTCILAHEQDGIEKLFRIPKRAYSFLDSEIKPALDRGGGSKYEMFFPENNSRIYADLESRGDTIHRLHISEIAFVKDMNRVFATLECVPLHGKITWETTPNGLNHFYRSWMDTDSNYAKCFFPWFFHEEYRIDNNELTQKDLTIDEIEFIARAKKLYQIDITLAQISYRRFKKRELKHLFGQEYPEDDATCFLTSGNSPFDLAIIKRMYDNAPQPLETINGVRIYERMRGGEIYVIGADTAEGVEGDSSAAVVMSVSNRKQVAVFHSNSIKPGEFAEKLEEIAIMYTGKFAPLLAVERNNHGHAVLLKLDEVLQYVNLYRTRKENKKTDYEEVKLGWPTDKVTRPIMVDTCIEGVENGTVELVDRPTLGECLTLINNDGKIEAEEGNHDDCFMATCIAVQMCIEESRMGIYTDIQNKIKI